MSCLAGAPGAGRSSASAPKGSSIAGFPKSVRILRSSDFRQTYDRGVRISCPALSAFCLRVEGGSGPRIGITVPRALGSAVVRNRIKRRVREAVRARLPVLSPEWQVVINPRPRVLKLPFLELVAEVEKVFTRVNAQS